MTVERRQTACGMRHCYARRIVEADGRRKLLRTSTRWVERQRIIEAEANRIAMLNAATPRYGQCNRQALQLFELPACNVNAFLLDGRRPFSFSGKKMGVASVQRFALLSLRHRCRKTLRTCAKKNAPPARQPTFTPIGVKRFGGVLCQKNS